MEDFKDQISRATEQFLGEVVGLARQHAEGIFSSAFATVNGRPPTATSYRRAAGAVTGPSSRGHGVKRDPEELDQLACKFAQFVLSNPGLRIEQINRQIGTRTVELALPIRRLVAEGVIAAQGAKRSTTYHTGKNFSKWDGRVDRGVRTSLAVAPGGSRAGDVAQVPVGVPAKVGSTSTDPPSPRRKTSTRDPKGRAARERSSRLPKKSPKKSTRATKRGPRKGSSASAE